MSLTAKVISAVRWATGLTLLTQLLMWAVTIVVIRLLAPEDYGLMAMSMLFVSFAMLANEFGLGSALVQRTELTVEESRSAHGLILLLNVSLYALFYLSAPWIAGFFEESMLIGMIRVIALLFPILAIEVVPLALLERQLEFKKKTSIYLGANVSGVIVTLIFAISGAGVWSLIYGNLWAAIARTIAVNIAGERFIWPMFSFSSVRPMLGFGGFVAAERILWYMHSQADVLLIAKLLGKEKLGYYYVALNLASLIYAKTGSLMYEVGLPAFAGAQSDIAQVGRFFVRALRIVSFVVFPLMFGLAAVSPEAVGILLGEKWIAVVPLVLILSLSMPARILSNLFPPALQGTGHPKSSLINLALSVAVMVPALAIGALFDIRSVALVWVVVYPLVLLLIINRSRKSIGVDWPNVLRATIPPLAASLIMLATVMVFASRLLSTDISLYVRLASMVAVGALVYLAVSSMGMRAQLQEVLNLIRR